MREKQKEAQTAENYHINLIIMIFTAPNNYNYAKLFNNYCLLAINRNIMSFTTLIVRFMRIMCTARWLVIVRWLVYTADAKWKWKRRKKQSQKAWLCWLFVANHIFASVIDSNLSDTLAHHSAGRTLYVIFLQLHFWLMNVMYSITESIRIK